LFGPAAPAHQAQLLLAGGNPDTKREFMRAHPHSSRWKLSRQLCEALGWKQANGALRDVVCRSLWLILERGGEIELALPHHRRLHELQREGK